MNGGRLSNDETFLQGVGELRGQLHAPAPDPDCAQRALARIGLRYPEEAEQLGSLWRAAERRQCEALLGALLAQHTAESEE